MSTIDELAKRLGSAQQEVEGLLGRLTEFATVAASLKKTDQSMSSAADALLAASAALAKNTESTNDTLATLRSAIEVIQKTEPGRILDGQASLERSISTLQDSVNRDVAIPVNHLSNGLTKLPSQILDPMAKSASDTRATLAATTNAATKTLSKRQNVILLLLLANLALTAFLVFRYITQSVAQ